MKFESENDLPADVVALRWLTFAAECQHHVTTQFGKGFELCGWDAGPLLHAVLAVEQSGVDRGRAACRVFAAWCRQQGGELKFGLPAGSLSEWE